MAHDELSLAAVHIDDPTWSARQRLNQDVAVPYQWSQLERVGTIDNFRVAAGLRKGTRHGYFYTDSDAHKWAHAAANVLACADQPEVSAALDTYIALLQQAQEEDGYLFTFNQVHFPGSRWVNIQVEHELYTLGHLIEAGVALDRATGDARLLEVAAKVRHVPERFKEEERVVFWEARVAFGRLIVEAYEAGAWHKEGSFIGKKLGMTLTSTDRDRTLGTGPEALPRWLVEVASAVIDPLIDHLVPPDREIDELELEAGIVADEIEKKFNFRNIDLH